MHVPTVHHRSICLSPAIARHHDSILCNVKTDMTVHRLSSGSLGDSTRPAPVVNCPKDLDVAS